MTEIEGDGKRQIENITEIEGDRENDRARGG